MILEKAVEVIPRQKERLSNRIRGEVAFNIRYLVLCQHNSRIGESMTTQLHVSDAFTRELVGI